MTSEPDVFQMKALVLAAGQGKRLRPLTNSTPKPLLPFLGLPLLSHTLRKLNLLKNPAKDIAVNAHYLKERIATYQKQSKIPFYLSLEESVLGTGGAIDLLREKKWLQSDDHLLVCNGDIVSDIDLNKLVSNHRSSNAKATCVFIEHTAETTPCLTKDGFLIRIGGEGNRTFAGAYVLSPDFIRRISRGVSDVISTFREALAEGEAIGEYLHRGIWYDIGNPKAYAEAQLSVVSDQIKFNCLTIKDSLEFFGVPYSWKPGFFSATPHTGSKLKVTAPVVINGSFEMPSLVSVELDQTVIMPGASIGSAKVYRQICLDDQCIDF